MSSTSTPPPPPIAAPNPGDLPASGPGLAAPALGRSVGAGVSWMVLITVLTKVAAVVAQGLLGWLLTKDDFGLFAIAVAVSGLLVICRDGGVRDLLVQRGAAAYPGLSGPAFWMGFTFNLLTTAVLAVAAWPIAMWLYGDSRLLAMLWIIAISVPLATPAGILYSRLRVDLRFNTLSKLILIAALVRQISTVALAWFWPELGALCFAIPFIIVAAVESITACIVVADRPWRRLPQVVQWPGIFRQTRWLMFGSVANFALDFGPYLVIGLVLTKGVVGIYFFAYQLVAQLGVLLSHNLQVVVLSALARLNDDPERQRQAALRSLRAMMLAGSLSCVGIATVIVPLEQLIWRGRWLEITLPVQILAFLFPWRITFGLSSAMLLAQGRFKNYAGMTAFEGIGLTIAALIGALIQPTAVSVAICTGAWLLIGRSFVTLYTFWRTGSRVAPVLRALIDPWLVAAAAGAVTILVEDTLGFGHAAGAWLSSTMWASAWGVTHEVMQLTRIVIAGSICVGTFALGARLLLMRDLNAIVAVAPGRVRQLLSRMMLLG